jgi:hypothetical protein
MVGRTRLFITMVLLGCMIGGLGLTASEYVACKDLVFGSRPGAPVPGLAHSFCRSLWHASSFSLSENIPFSATAHFLAIILRC